MAIWAIQGIGLLINTIQSIQQANQMKQMQQQAPMMPPGMNMPGSTATAPNFGAAPDTKPLFNFEPPPFPQENFNNLQDMQMGQAQNREVASNVLQSDLQEMKSNFFQENHYGTVQGEDGKHVVAFNEQGQPRTEPGAETPEQKLARTEFETQTKAELTAKHADEKDNFIQGEKQNIQDFLQQNRDQLQNPAVHAELQKMVVDSKKKSLELQQNQEDERLRADLPPDEKIALRLQQGTQGLHQMDKEHIQSEQDSPDAKALMEHDQKVAALLGDQKERARQDKKEDEFLMDPRKMMAAKNQNQGPKDVGDHLPAYLAAHCYDLGVYSV